MNLLAEITKRYGLAGLAAASIIGWLLLELKAEREHRREAEDRLLEFALQYKIPTTL